MYIKYLIPLVLSCCVSFTLGVTPDRRISPQYGSFIFITPAPAGTAIAPTNEKNINAIVGHQEKTYAFDGLNWLEDGTGFIPHAYELTNGVQTNKFALPRINQGAVQQSSFVVGDTLYQFSGAYGEASLSSYSLPLSDPVTATNTVDLPYQIQEIPAVLSAEDNIAVVLCSRYLTVVSLSSFTVTASQLVVVGPKKTPGSLVYNHQNNKVYYFQTNPCSAGFCQHIYVFDISADGEISQAEEYDTFAPDYTTSFHVGELSGCAIDYAENSIWCMNNGPNQLVEFSIENLNNYTVMPLPGTLTKGQVSFDFTGRRVFVPSAHGGGEGYTIYELNLEAHMVSHYVSNANPIASITFANSPNSVNIGSLNSTQVNMMSLDANGNNDAHNQNIVNLL